MAMVFNSSYIHDRPTKEDTLGRSHFAKALAHSLVLSKGSPGLVVGIEGNWGSGKSTLINLITNSLGEIAEGSMPIVVEFNPWMVSNTGAQVEALIGQIAASIGKDFSSGNKGIETGQKLLSYVGLLKHLKFLKYIPALEWAGHLAADIPDIAGTIAKTAEQSTEAVQGAINDVKKLLPSLDLPQKKNEVVAALGELDRPIVVVIDDLDRLPAEEIRIMIQAIKAVADFPRITYLLAYDRSIIARALAAEEESGLSYLEKIVQVAYPIPPLSQQQLKNFAKGKVQGVLDVLHITLRDYEKERYEKAIVLLTRLVRHPRDVVRIVNRLILSLPATHGEVNAADVIVFEALSQRFPSLRESIHSHSADFTGHSFRHDLIDENADVDWEEYLPTEDKDKTQQPWLKHLPKDERDHLITNKACLFLFSTQEKDGRRSSPEDYLGIADPDRLARLFRMTSIEEVPEAKEIHELLMEPEKLKDVLSMKDDEELYSLLDWVFNYIPSCPAPNVKGCIEKLIEASQKLANQCELTDKMGNKFAKVMERLLRQKSPECNECFLSITQNAPLPISGKIVVLAAANQGTWRTRPEGKVNEEHQLISDSNLVDRAIQTWTGRVRDCDAQGDLYKEASLHSILNYYAQFNDNYKGAYSAISKMCETEKGLAAFLRYFQKEFIFHDGSIKLIEDAEKLAQYITTSTLKDEYLWLADLLSEKENILLVREQAAKLKLAF